MPPETSHNEDDFQKELVELFSQEAQEWLVQIDAALAELEGQPAADRYVQVVDAIVRAITSLGGSAATINLPDVERATFALLPFIETVRDRTTASPADYATIRQQFRTVTDCVRNATGLSVSLKLTDEPPLPVQRIDVSAALGLFRTSHKTDLNKQGAASRFMSNLIQRLEQEAQQGATHIEFSRFEAILDEILKTDQRVFENLRRILSEISGLIERLKVPDVWTDPAQNTVTPALVSVQQLQGQAKQINALALVVFLTGLYNFLTLVSNRRFTIASRKLDAVIQRIAAVLATTQEWVERGQQEREAIVKMLPAPM